MPRVLLLATTTGYQTRAFADAAERLGVDLVYATDRCDVLDDPWQDRAVPIRFSDDQTSVTAILEATRGRPLDGVLAVGDRPTVIAAHVCAALGLQGHPVEAAVGARSKQLTRERLRSAGLPVPWFLTVPITTDPRTLSSTMTYPCVVKPVALSGSRGVIRANDEAELVAAFYRLRAILQARDIRSERQPEHAMAVVEGFIPGREFAVEGILDEGALRLLAIFDKPDPLDGPFFEETIYVTPSSAPAGVQQEIAETLAQAAAAVGLLHGPVHAECRVNDHGVFVLEVAARPIGGLCARALRFVREGSSSLASLEEVLLRHALGQSCEEWKREADASGVMMIPIPRRGVLRDVAGLDEARSVDGVFDVRITAKPDQALVPLPEGASYLGFIFARAGTPGEVEHALRTAHRHVEFTIDPEVPMLQSLHG
jgi:biotin carboxylase